MAGTTRLYVVCGPPAGGKTRYGEKLALRVGAMVVDSDVTTEPVVEAGMGAAGLCPDDRDSDLYKKLFREPVYEALFRLAEVNLAWLSVVLVAPFTKESRDEEWPVRLTARFGVPVEIHFVTCPPEVRRERMRSRGEARDVAKLDDWDAHLASIVHSPPPFGHVLVETGPPGENRE
ncbi:MAG TPA: hypothetical protein DIV54_02275 [Verrucomicrobiales bacterium]|nr:hypothetical protein [Roseibacillus sp.]HCQ32296.1 hypothetical protein [Verrucomicrobiales bacterium]|tara:strand:+ start:52 stop:579 length:528 start_codon:yes stop_codon:yes gene_type:complete